MPSETGILITAFNRPLLLENLLISLENCSFSIYLSIDAAKAEDVKNKDLVVECHAIATRFSYLITELLSASTNQGCFLGVSNAISWGFSKVARLIILEDDVLPSTAFLNFANQMLEEFEDNLNVGSIGGTNLVPNDDVSSSLDDYRFSAYTTSWGWATWADRWRDYETDLESFPKMKFISPDNFWNFSKRRYWRKIFAATANGIVDTWDYRWLYSNWKHGRVAIIPNSNLVLNVGFGEEATHTKDSPWWLPSLIDESFLVTQIPKVIIRDIKADSWMEANHFRSLIKLQLRNNIAKKFPNIAYYYRKYLKRDEVSYHNPL